MVEPKTKNILYKLTFPQGIHIGKNKLSDAQMEIGADTLFSAMCLEAQKFDEKGAEKLFHKAMEGGVRLSDAFPFVGEEIFLPKPLMKIRGREEDSSEKKLFKRIPYVPLSRWDDYLQGKSNPQEIIEQIEKIDEKKVFAKIKHDQAGEHNIYQLGAQYFHGNSGLYFILQCPEEDELYFSDLLLSMEKSGIGGKRKVGLGIFESYDRKPPSKLKDLLEKKSKTYLTLSLAHPRKEEAQDVINNSPGYQLVRRGGFITSEKEAKIRRKKDLYMFQSGSIFTKKFKGDIVDVGCGFAHPVYRYGMPIFIGVEENE